MTTEFRPQQKIDMLIEGCPRYLAQSKEKSQLKKKLAAQNKMFKYFMENIKK